jgi:queuine tRNA-ribosyltransferase
LNEHQKLTKLHPERPYQALYGVIQGAHYQDLREKAAKDLGAMDFDGYGLGGSFEKQQLGQVLAWVNAILPQSKPRHLLGLSRPDDIFVGVENGADTFDCVAPTREARHGRVYTPDGDINLGNAKYKNDNQPLQPGCQCLACQGKHTRASLRQMLKNTDNQKSPEQHRQDKALAQRLLSIHNIHFILDLASQIRQHILNGNLVKFRDDWLGRYYHKS